MASSLQEPSSLPLASMKNLTGPRHNLSLVKFYYNNFALRVLGSSRKPCSTCMAKTALLSLWMRAVGGLPGICFDLFTEPSFPGGFAEQYGSVFATPGVAEKGRFDVRVEVTAPGGHSSVPPKHTVSF